MCNRPNHVSVSLDVTSRLPLTHAVDLESCQGLFSPRYSPIDAI